MCRSDRDRCPERYCSGDIELAPFRSGTDDCGAAHAGPDDAGDQRRTLPTAGADSTDGTDGADGGS